MQVPFGFAQGSLFDYAIRALLRVTSLCESVRTQLIE
jgi:hypothetical protein